MYDNFVQLLNRLSGYSPAELIVELAVIWIVVYLIVRFLRGTRGAGILKGFAFLLILGTLIIRVLGQDGEGFQRLYFLYSRSLAFAAFALLVIFQPELRRALIRLGEARLFSSTTGESQRVIDAVVRAAEFNAKNKIGMLVAIERNVGLSGLGEGGTQIGGEVSAPLLQTIFWPNTPLHDLGVLIQGAKVVAAGVQFPLAESGELAVNLGSRHRAAVGVTQESDCIAVVVSEETGMISVAERGVLRREFSGEELRRYLTSRLVQEEEPEAPAAPASPTRATEPATGEEAKASATPVP